MSNVLSNAFNDAIEILFLIDEPIATAIDSQFYDTLADTKMREAEKSTWLAFQQNLFYQQLPPKLQDKLVQICLDRHYSLIQHFVIDQETGYTSDSAIQRRIVTSLHNEVFEFGKPIIRKGNHPVGILFVKEQIVTVLGIKESVRLLDLDENSYFGEWEVIFNKRAERSYIATNINHQSDVFTQVYFIKPNDFHAIMSISQDFDKFQRTRALRRRAYVRHIELQF